MQFSETPLVKPLAKSKVKSKVKSKRDSEMNKVTQSTNEPESTLGDWKEKLIVEREKEAIARKHMQGEPKRSRSNIVYPFIL